MSTSNLKTWKALGRPNTQEFKDRLGLQCGDLDCGFMLCCLGPFIGTDLRSLEKYNHDDVLQRLEKHLHTKGVIASRHYRYHMPHQILEFADSHLEEWAPEQPQPLPPPPVPVPVATPDSRARGRGRGWVRRRAASVPAPAAPADGRAPPEKAVQDVQEEEENVSKPAKKRLRRNSFKHWQNTCVQSTPGRVSHQLVWPDGSAPPCLPKGFKSIRVTCKVCTRSVIGKSWRTLERDPIGCLGRPEKPLHAQMRSQAKQGIQHAVRFIKACPCCPD